MWTQLSPEGEAIKYESTVSPFQKRELSFGRHLRFQRDPSVTLSCAETFRNGNSEKFVAKETTFV